MKIRASPDAPNLYINDGEMDEEIHPSKLFFTTFESFLTGEKGGPRRRLHSRSRRNTRVVPRRRFRSVSAAMKIRASPDV